MITFDGYPKNGGLYTGYNVLRDEQKIGFIGAGGGFYQSDAKIALTEEEKRTVRTGCKQVYEMPSEYGCLGVGESPTTQFNKSNCGV